MMIIKRGGDDDRFSPDKPKLKRAVDWRRVLALFTPYWRQELAVLACIIASALLGLAPAILTKRIVDVSLTHRDMQSLIVNASAMIVAAAVAGMLGVAQGYFNSWVGQGIMRDLRIDLVSHLQNMPISFFTNTKSGMIMNRVTNDVDNVEGVVTGTLASIVSSFVVIITAICAMFILSWQLSLLALAVVPIMVLPLLPVGKRMYLVKRQTREKRDEMQGIAQETLSVSGITLVKSFVREASEAKRYGKLATDLMKYEISLAMVGRWFMGLIGAMVTIGPALVWLGGGVLLIHFGLSVGTIVAFVALLARLYTPASSLVGVQVQVVSAFAVFERIFDYLDLAREPSGTKHVNAITGAVDFEDVRFSYVAERPTLRGIDFHIEPGQVAAFVGPSGGGKTTITQLVPRFLNPQSGRVLIDGVDVRECDVYSLRAHIGMVTQETYLFHDTIEANLRYGRQDASHAEVEAAAAAANLLTFISSLPDGFATVVGERGHKLSGGERQRLAIARLLLKDPRILILDEATSSLDSANEALIQAAFEKAMLGRTSLVIAHRLTTILSADVIFVVEDGRIVERGKHADLLARGGAYARLYYTQFERGNSNGAELDRAAAPSPPPMMKFKRPPQLTDAVAER